METLQHKWVKHTVTKVSALPDLDDDRQVVVIEDPDDVQAAEEGAVFGCDACGVKMEGNTDTTCNPVCHCGTDWEHHQSETHSFVEMR
jgi:hypothetical protein